MILRWNRVEVNRYIHLLYVPTMACNMCCKYCYLEDNAYIENVLNLYALALLKTL